MDARARAEVNRIVQEIKRQGTFANRLASLEDRVANLEAEARQRRIDEIEAQEREVS